MQARLTFAACSRAFPARDMRKRVTCHAKARVICHTLSRKKNVADLCSHGTPLAGSLYISPFQLQKQRAQQHQPPGSHADVSAIPYSNGNYYQVHHAQMCFTAMIYPTTLPGCATSPRFFLQQRGCGTESSKILLPYMFFALCDSCDFFIQIQIGICERNCVKNLPYVT